jgi:hypothetical protein
MTYKSFRKKKSSLLTNGELYEASQYDSGVTEDKKYDSKKDFLKAFSKAWKRKLPITIYDETQSRLVGFITESRNKGQVWHYISASKIADLL